MQDPKEDGANGLCCIYDYTVSVGNVTVTVDKRMREDM
jgi:hypothetical protein